MQIGTLRLVGFKSFVEPAELTIAPGLTGIVGPNGCGKSNLLEAMRWAMGESSPRSLRGSGMDDVIFAGTTIRPPRDFAEVMIRAERAGDGDTIEIVRRIERGAGSAYRIDGRDVRQKDVALLFADAATGAHSPALVSQNRISAVISAKPAERRQMLEEAAGIAGLHVRRRDAEQKLRATEGNLEQLGALLSELEARAATLRRQARAADRYRALSAEIRMAEARLIWARWRDAKAAADAAHAAARIAEAAVADAAETQRQAALAQARALAQATEARGAREAARGVVGGLRQRVATTAAERDRALHRVAELDRARAQIAGDLAREDRLGVDASEALAALGAEDRALADALARAMAAQPAQDAGLQAVENGARDAELTLAQVQARQATELADIRVANAAWSAARERLRRAEADQAAVTRDGTRLGEVAPLQAARDAAGRAAVAALAARDLAAAEIAGGEQARDAAAQARDAAEAQRSAAAAALAALTAEAGAIDRALGATAAQGDRALARLRVAPGYERALAAALGDDLDAVIGIGPRAWTGGGAATGDPALPPGVEPLADRVAGPVELARRLAQVGVVMADDGAAVLAVGQRLVTRDGRLRRWDGYVAADVGAAAAERLVRVNRRAALAEQIPPAQAAVAAANDDMAGAVAALAVARDRIERGRRGQAEAEDAGRRARRDEDQAAAAIDRLTADRAALAVRAARMAADVETARDAVQAAADAVAGVPDGETTRIAVDAARAAAVVARDAVAAARARAAAAAAGIAADRRRQDVVRADMRSWRARAGDAARRIDEMTRRAATLADEAATLAGIPEQLADAIAQQQGAARAAGDAADRAERLERDAEAERARADLAAAAGTEALATAREQRAGAVARAEAEDLRRVEMGRVSGERFACPAAVLPERVMFDPAAVRTVADESKALERASADRERIGPVNLVAATELAEAEGAGRTLAAERDELAQAVQALRGSIGQLNREGRARLQAAFEAVDGHFRRLFTTLFGGGEAHLAFVDSDDPLEAGLEIMAQPPGKRLATLTLLSGGEQALTAVALIFALFLTNPAPICVLDEVDAPLDDANIERFCDLLDRMTAETETRYLIVTHNAVTMARMHRLFGVTMVERGVSRLVSVDLGAAETLLAEA
ncbi:MAG TPA: AAA family ATPase [Sphingomonas sp.]|uniref:chromosome segregation SMC family protein n=1 Tax=Sphingomonas sp. TaxID=28214 RepID=UPI002EDB6952